MKYKKYHPTQISEKKTPHLKKHISKVRTNQELSGHKNLQSTMIYAHVMNQGGKGVRNPADF